RSRWVCRSVSQLCSLKQAWPGPRLRADRFPNHAQIFSRAIWDPAPSCPTRPVLCSLPYDPAGAVAHLPPPWTPLLLDGPHRGRLCWSHCDRPAGDDAAWRADPFENGRIVESWGEGSLDEAPAEVGLAFKSHAKSG